MHARISALFLALVLACTGLASAQGTTGTISGRIVDSQGLAVPGATVTVTGPQGMRHAFPEMAAAVEGAAAESVDAGHRAPAGSRRKDPP